MPSSDRTAPGRDRPEAPDVPRGSGRAKAADRPIEPPQYFDPREPWDPESAEALTRLYESGEGYLDRRPEDERVRRWQPFHAPDAPPAMEPASPGSAALEARLAEVAERLQGSLAGINPDKAAEHLNHRLDQIEERFNEALGRVAQRSDLDGLKLIEAHVLELAAHVEQTRGRLDRIDAIDERMESLARRLEESDQQRLDALEKLLQDYIAEWRRSDERTAGALQNLEGAVSRMGESIEAMEAQKPVADLSLSLLGPPGPSAPAIGSDPISQVYADAARALEPTSAHRPPLDAADYAPAAETRAESAPEMPTQEPSTALPGRSEEQPADVTSPSPTSRALAMRAKLRAQPLSSEARPAPPPEAGPQSRWQIRSRLLLAGGITLFAAIGYLLVDLFLSPAMPLGPQAAEHRAQPPADARADVALAPPHASEDAGGTTPPLPDGAGHEPAGDRRQQGRILPLPQMPRIEAIGSAMAAAFRGRHDGTRPGIVSPASIHQDSLAPGGEAASRPMATLPMTIGPASLRQAAMRGDAAAQLEVASRYAAGHGVARDLEQAVYWYGRAAAQGSAVAQYRLGALHERGWGTARDAERARVWYARAAEQGNVKAMHNLAVLSVSGGRSDYAAAAKWFTQAAEFGLVDSQVNLAILYQSGLGVPKDLAEAFKWLTLAARGGDREAAGRISQIKSGLGSAELQAADAAIAAWRPRSPEPAANEATADASFSAGW